MAKRRNRSTRANSSSQQKRRSARRKASLPDPSQTSVQQRQSLFSFLTIFFIWFYSSFQLHRLRSSASSSSQAPHCKEVPKAAEKKPVQSEGRAAAKAKPDVPPLLLDSVTSDPEEIVAAVSARSQGAEPGEELKAVCVAKQGPPKAAKKLWSMHLSGLHRNKPAIVTIVLVLMTGFALWHQNLVLRRLSRELGVMNQIANVMPDLNLAQKFYDGMPGLGNDMGISSLGLKNLSQAIGSSLSGITFPEMASLQAILHTVALPRPGFEMRQKGYRPKHPTIIIPGFVTSGLELWETLPCAQSRRRERIWGSWAMTRSFLLSKQCWLDHLRLDEVTGMDPEGVKVRASQGLEAVDYFMAGYHVWARLIEAFADFGYDSNNLITEPYDWRLAVPNLEKRDGYFTRLKARIETVKSMHQEKVFVVSHSWGDNVFRSFMSWVSASSPSWVEEHVAIYTNIAGPTLGVPKAVSSFLSGETRDTVEMGYLANMLANAHFTRQDRTKLFRSWGGGIGMLPIGGQAIWGNSSWAPDDTKQMRALGETYGNLLTMWERSDEVANISVRQHPTLLDTLTFGMSTSKASDFTRSDVRRLHVDQAIEVLMEEAGPHFRTNVHQWSAVHNRSRGAKRCGAHGQGDKFYYNPLHCPLPDAPSLQMFCLYGVDIPTERAYQYEHLQTEKAFDAAKEGDAISNGDPTELDVRYKIYTDASGKGGRVDHGMRLSDGDGTVPLLSLGGLCRKHWRDPRLNPAGIKVVTREYKHEPVMSGNVLNPFYHYQNLRNLGRGGPRSADHVDILSHELVLRDALYLASGAGSDLGDTILSNIDKIVSQISINETLR